MIGIKRRHYLVDKPVQLRYIGLVIIPMIALLSALYYVIYYSVFRWMLIPEAVVATLLPAMKDVNIILVFSLPVAIILVVRIALIYSNRIVGPIPRLERDLDKVISGDYSKRLKVRDKDELVHFTNKINQVLEELEKNRRA